MHKLLLFLKPIQIFIQRLGYTESDFTVEIVDKLLSKIKAGDIVGSYESGRFTSIFIKGNYDHAAMVNDSLYVVEAVGDKFANGKNVGGVRKVRLEEWIWKKNHIFVARHKNPEVAKLASVEVNKHIGKNYDYGFQHGDETLYCSELEYTAYKPFDSTFMNKVQDNDEILPIDYINDPALTLIYDSRVNIEPT